MIYKQKNSRFWYVVYNFKTPDGKWKKKWICSNTENEKTALKFERHILDSIGEIKRKQRLESFLGEVATALTGQTMQKSGFPLSLVWDTYSKSQALQSLTDRTISSKKIIWNNFLEWLSKNYPADTINAITPSMAKEYMIKKYSDKSQATYNNHRFNLSHIWRELMIDTGMTANIWDNVSSPARKTAMVYRPFEDSEIKTIMEKSQGFWKYASIISCHTGLRLKDVVLLQWSQIDFDKGIIRLKPHKVARFEKFVSVPLHNDVIEVLKAIPRKSDNVFPETIKEYGTNDFGIEFGHILANCGITDNEKGIVGFHSWRTTFISRVRASGLSTDDTRRVVGHSKAAMTEHYDHSKASTKIKKLKSITKQGK